MKPETKDFLNALEAAFLVPGIILGIGSLFIFIAELASLVDASDKEIGRYWVFTGYAAGIVSVVLNIVAYQIHLHYKKN